MRFIQLFWWAINDIAETVRIDWKHYWFRKKAKPLKDPKTTLECLQQYAEKVVIDSGINLENVLVHDLGQFGFAGRSYTYDTFTTYQDIRYDFKMPLAQKPYIVVPEITGWWEFRAWLHEVGHYKNKHYCELIKPTYIQEYEAEKYCLDMAILCPHVTVEIYLNIKQSAVTYLGSHIETAINDGIIKTFDDIPKDVIKLFDDTNGVEQIKQMLKDKRDKDSEIAIGIYEDIFG